jgi:hypothetical protein
LDITHLQLTHLQLTHLQFTRLQLTHPSTCPLASTATLSFLPPRQLRSEGTQPLQMAGSSRPKKGTTKSPQSPQSPERKRRGKAAAAPKPRSVDVNNEDYNVRSPERTRLLTQIKAKLNDDLVSPAFWACCQLADMNRLEVVATMDRLAIDFFQEPLNTLPLQCELPRF